MLTDHHPVTHQKELKNAQSAPDNCQFNIERSEIRQISDSAPMNTDQPEEKCAQHTVHFIGAQDQSDAGSLTTQAPQSSSIRATINALSTWISAVMVPRGLDQRLTNRLSSRPGRRRQRAFATMLRQTSRRGFYSHTP